MDCTLHVPIRSVKGQTKKNTIYPQLYSVFLHKSSGYEGSKLHRHVNMMIRVLFPTCFIDNSDTTSSVTLLHLKTQRVYDKNNA